jgi:hypothetical protein
VTSKSITTVSFFDELLVMVAEAVPHAVIRSEIVRATTSADLFGPARPF